jgi:hypothetical protein
MVADDGWVIRWLGVTGTTVVVGDGTTVGTIVGVGPMVGDRVGTGVSVAVTDGDALASLGTIEGAGLGGTVLETNVEP